MAKKEKNVKKRHSFFLEIKKSAKEEPFLFAVYFVLRFIVIAALVMSLVSRDYERSFVCLLVLVLFMIPAFVEKRLNIEIPNVLEIIILVFIFAAEILGELESYFVHYQHWDTMLHTTSGFIFAAVGYSMVDILNKNSKFKFELSPIFMAMVSFCFAMTIGVLWEFFEFAADYFLHLDMQKDTVIHAFSSVTLDPTQSNIPIRVEDITDVAVNGESLGLDGYLDIGLYDTMEDLFVNFIGAVVFSVLGFFDAKSKGRGIIVHKLVPYRKDGENSKKR